MGVQIICLFTFGRTVLLPVPALFALEKGDSRSLLFSLLPTVRRRMMITKKKIKLILREELFIDFAGDEAHNLSLR